MTAQEILALNTTKTEKMLKLFELGYTRTQVAEMLGVGYGFVQNVYARRYGTRRTPIQQIVTSSEWTFTRKFGVEIEAFNVSRENLERALNNAGIRTRAESYNHNARNHWKIVGDASISGSNSFELVSPPLEGMAGLTELQTVCRVLGELNAKVNRSCGLHLHFDASAMTIESWKNLYVNYATFEDAIDQIMPVSRRANNNRYCNTMKVRNYRQKIDNCLTLQAIELEITMGTRYYKLNTQAYWRHRTVEFRQHSGTIEYSKISNWVKICAQLLDYSMSSQAAQGGWDNFKAILQDEQKNYIEQRKENLQRVSA